MHRIHAIRLALLCCAVVGLAACGSGSQVQVNYGSLANAICLKLTAQTKPGVSSADRIQAIETALSGLQALNPPATVQKIYLDLVGNYQAAVDLLKPNMDTLARLAKRLDKHPHDKAAEKRYATLTGKIRGHLQSAASDAHTLGIGNCEAAFSR